MKPSERNPGASMFIMKLAQEAGIPDGCINVIHGSVERNNICYVSTNKEHFVPFETFMVLRHKIPN